MVSGRHHDFKAPMAALQTPGLHPSTGILSDRPRLTQGPGVRWRTLFGGEGPGAGAGAPDLGGSGRESTPGLSLGSGSR
jgi:hypothetical protein